MSLSRNVIAGVANSAWTAILGLAAVPLYIKYLGVESYGLIGVYATVQALLQLLDMGLAPTMNRELARCSAGGSMREARNLLHTMAVVYWSMALCIGLAALALAPIFALHWLKAQTLSVATLEQAMVLLGLVVACRWPIGLYQGALMGMQRYAVSSTINMVMVSIGTIGALAVLAFVSQTVEAFFLWQAGIALAHVAIVRMAAWKSVGSEGAGSFNPAALQRIWRFSAGMSAITVSSIFLTQLDKIVLSKMLSLEDFGRYAFAGVLASGLYVLLTPVFNVIYPRMTSLATTGQLDALVWQYKSGTQLLASVLFPVAIAIALFANDILYLWTGDATLATTSAPLVSVLIIGTAFNGIMIFPFALQLANGRTGLTLRITLILAALLGPMIVFLTSRFGAVGGAFAWLALNFCYLFFGSWMTHRVFFKDKRINWLSHDVGVPLALSTIVLIAGWKVLHQPECYKWNLAFAALLTLLAILANAMMLPRKLKSRFQFDRSRFV